MNRQALLVCIVLVSVCRWISAPLSAQSALTGSIAGYARDETGLVLPGATVEVASPALIEKVRSSITDGQGRYNIVDLRPGEYTVTFTLPGFSGVRREGIQLTGGFTANINAELHVGSIEETVTVSGASPLVDIENARSMAVISDEVIKQLPSGRMLQSYGALTLGVKVSQLADVGGAQGEQTNTMTIRGSRGNDATLVLDGMRYNDSIGSGGGGARTYTVNVNYVEEVVLETGGQTAQVETGGIQINHVPKSGSNTFKTWLLGNFTNRSLQSDNLSDELRARGVAFGPKVNHTYDLGGSIGGPVKQDKLWFFTTHRVWDSNQLTPGLYFNKKQGTIFFEPDLDRPGFSNSYAQDHTLRMTWQATSKQKYNFTESVQNSCLCYYWIGANEAPEERVSHDLWPTMMPQVTWSYAASNRLLFDVGATYAKNGWKIKPVKEVSPTDIPIQNLSTGLLYGASTQYTDDPGPMIDQANGRASMSYVSGSHAIKAGVTWLWGWYITRQRGQGTLPVVYGVLQPTQQSPLVPSRITEYSYPTSNDSRAWDTGFYVQDQWSLNRLTLNLGLRLDRLRGWVPPQTKPAGPFSPAIDIQRIDNLPNWTDLSPRIGASFDLFGNGKTALKGYFGRFVQGELTSIAAATNPATAVATSATRTWNDTTFPVGDPRRGNFEPDCNLQITAANDECGALSSSTFGTPVITQRYAPEILTGWGVRPKTQQIWGELQHELRAGLSARAGYYRTSYHNFFATDNLAVGPGDYDPYCITAPADARLPGGGGSPVCGLADIKPTAFGLTDNLITQASNYGEQTQIYNGFELQMNMRFGKGGLLAAGVSNGHTTTEKCFVIDSPQLYQCRQVQPDSQVKVSFNYPLPVWALQVSGVYQNLTGIPIQANYVAPNTAIADSLGRNLGQCRGAAVCNGTVTIPLIEPFTQYEDRLSQFDFRASKSFQFGRKRLQAMVDLFNMFNANTVLTRSDAYGGAGADWGKPSAILTPRMLKFGAQLEF